MNWYKKALQMLGDAELDLGSGNFEAVFISSAYAADLSDSGHQFKSDLTGILATVSLANVTWSNRVLDADDFSITDPGSGTATQCVILKNTGSDATSPVILHDDIADLVFDGTNDSATVNGSGLGRIGGA